MRTHPTVFLVKVLCYGDGVSSPLGLGYLAAHLRGVADVRLLDGIRQRLTPEPARSAARRADRHTPTSLSRPPPRATQPP